MCPRPAVSFTDRLQTAGDAVEAEKERNTSPDNEDVWFFLNLLKNTFVQSEASTVF